MLALGLGLGRASTSPAAQERVRDRLVGGVDGGAQLAGNVMLVFAGGVSLSELALVRECCAKNRGLRVHVVATSLLTQADMAQLLFPAATELCRTATDRQKHQQSS